MEWEPDDAPEPNQTSAIEHANTLTIQNQNDLKDCFNKNLEIRGKLMHLVNNKKNAKENNQITEENKKQVSNLLNEACHSYQYAFTSTHSTPARILESQEHIKIAHAYITKADAILNKYYNQEPEEKTKNDPDESQNKNEKKCLALIPKPSTSKREKSSIPVQAKL
jgi:hypothetical protein